MLPTPCIRRGDDLADDEIFEGYRGRLDAAIRHLRSPSPASRRAPRLIVRNCHAGTRDSRRRDGRLEQPQLLALQRMNAIIAAVASEHAVELLDVYELDRIAGFATEAADENFHVTQPMATRVRRSHSCSCYLVWAAAECICNMWRSCFTSRAVVTCVTRVSE